MKENHSRLNPWCTTRDFGGDHTAGRSVRADNEEPLTDTEQ